MTNTHAQAPLHGLEGSRQVDTFSLVSWGAGHATVAGHASPRQKEKGSTAIFRASSRGAWASLGLPSAPELPALHLPLFFFTPI